MKLSRQGFLPFTEIESACTDLLEISLSLSIMQQATKSESSRNVCKHGPWDSALPEHGMGGLEHSEGL